MRVLRPVNGQEMAVAGRRSATGHGIGVRSGRIGTNTSLGHIQHDKRYIPFEYRGASQKVISPPVSRSRSLALASSFILVMLTAALTPVAFPIVANGAPSQATIARPMKVASDEFCPTSSCSTNWGGFAVTGAAGSVSDVKGSWMVPSVSCAKRGSSYAALWIGIDGYSSSTVEQTGVLAHCNNGKATYSAWYEFYPANSVTISGFSVSPGQTIAAEVSYSTSTGLFTTTITNVNTGSTFSTSSSVSGAQRSSAEWITERPETCTLFGCKLTALANFGTADFGTDYTSVSNTNYATVNGQTGPISTFSNVAITMVSLSGSTLAQTSPLSPDGTSFYMTWG